MRTVVFWEEGFPFADTRPQGRESLRAGVSALEQVDFVSSDLLPAALASGPALFVNPYGSAFPRAAVDALVSHLERGGRWLNLGGAPLTRLCTHAARPASGSGWQVDPRQSNVLRRLRLGDASECSVPPESSFVCPPADAAIETVLHRYRPHAAWSFRPDLDGPEPAGPRDGWLRPVVLAEAGGARVAAPVVALDWVRGPHAGGRWVLCACQSSRTAPADLIRRLVDYAARPHAEVTVRPTFACYYPGESPSLTVQVDASTAAELRISVRVYCRESQREAYAHLFRASAASGPAIVRSSPFLAPDPGIYVVRVSVEAQGLSKPIGAGEGGFWVYDRALLTRPDARAVGSAGWQGLGARYQPKDAPRDYLRAPSAAAWDSDLAAVAHAGAAWVEVAPNLVGPGRLLPDGTLDEGVLRAVTAMALTARRHGLGLVLDHSGEPDGPRSLAAALEHRLDSAEGVGWRLPGPANQPRADSAGGPLFLSESPHRSPRLRADGAAPPADEAGHAAALERMLATAVSAGETSPLAGPWHPDGSRREPLLRADGTEGPALAVLRRFAGFLQRTEALRVGRVPEEAVVLAADRAWGSDDWRGQAAREAVRVLEHGLGVACRTATEEQLAELADARLVVLPSPDSLGDACWAGLARGVERGAVVLLTGAVTEPNPLVAPTPAAGVAAIESLALGDAPPRVVEFGPGVRGTALRAVGAPDAPTSAVLAAARGKGAVMHVSLPVELAEPGAARQVYAQAASAAGLPTHDGCPGLLERVTEYAEVTLFAAVNETGSAQTARTVAVAVPAGRAALALLRRRDGKVIDALEPDGTP